MVTLIFVGCSNPFSENYDTRARIYRQSSRETSPKRSFSMTEKEHFGHVFAKTGSKNSGTGKLRTVDLVDEFSRITTLCVLRHNLQESYFAETVDRACKSSIILVFQSFSPSVFLQRTVSYMLFMNKVTKLVEPKYKCKSS